MSDDTPIIGANGSPISGTSSATQSDAEKASTGLADNFDSFLKLLTTQLQQQDPTQPMDTNEFTAQIVQFTAVEQSVKTNANLEKLIQLTEQQYSGLDQGTAVNYLGKYVAVDGATRTTVGGAATWPFEAQGNAVMASVGVYDSDGQLVSIEEVTLAGRGSYNYDWNGKDLEGNQVKDGDYTIQIIAYDENGGSVPVDTDGGGKVTAVDFVNGDYIMKLDNGQEYTLDKVLRVTENAPNESTNATVEDPLVYLGKTVAIDTSYQNHSGSGAQYQFGLTGTPSITNIQIIDQDGTIVKTDSMNLTAAGVYTYTWDGKDQSGNTAQYGEYSIKIDVFDADGKVLQPTTQTKGLVTAIDLSNGEYRVQLEGGDTYNLDRIKQVISS